VPPLGGPESGRRHDKRPEQRYLIFARETYDSFDQRDDRTTSCEPRRVLTVVLGSVTRETNS